MSKKINQISGIREEYTLGELRRRTMESNPIDQFNRWFEEAIERNVMEPNAMALSTVSSTGQPSSRIVLLKGFDQNGFIFYTNYKSHKGSDLASNPLASLLFFWPALQRQIRIDGRVEKISSKQSDAYFHSRPVGSQLGALASPQSQEVATRQILENRLSQAEDEFQRTKKIERPEFWGGFILKPDRLEFWQGRANRLHDRFVYEWSDNTDHWDLKRLAP